MLRLPERDVGPVTVAVIAAAYALVWYLGEPDGQAAGSFLGQLFGAESVLLLSIALVLISTLPWVERWFDGIDRAAIWHRRLAIVGLLLLVPHVLLSKSGAERSRRVAGGDRNRRPCRVGAGLSFRVGVRSYRGRFGRWSRACVTCGRARFAVSLADMTAGADFTG